MARRAHWMGLVAAALLSGCGGGGDSTPAAAATNALSALSPTAALGQKIFNDVSLSASGRQSCATCHVSSQGHSPNDGLPTQMGGVAMDHQGLRHTPSLRYLSSNGAFHFDSDGTPTGGFFWDGRADSLKAQAAQPFLNPAEMANASASDVVQRLAKATYADDFKAVYGADIFNQGEAAFDRATLALQQYQMEDPIFRPFNSQYDNFLRGTASLNASELRGLALFNNPQKGNCIACHPSGRASDGGFPLFTDFSYDSLGVPRNPRIAANSDPTHFDLGLCARSNGDLTQRADLCGRFKVPTLRNVAVRQAFFHNSYFSNLKDAITFYVQRDTQPDKWYPLNADGSVDKFNDMPLAYRRNVNTSEAPYSRQPGMAPALSDDEINDLIAFLHTLTDADLQASR